MILIYPHIFLIKTFVFLCIRYDYLVCLLRHTVLSMMILPKAKYLCEYKKLQKIQNLFLCYVLAKAAHGELELFAGYQPITIPVKNLSISIINIFLSYHLCTANILLISRLHYFIS